MGVGDIYQAAVDQSLHGVAMTNVFHFEQTFAGTGEDEKDLAGAIEDDILPTWILAMSDDWEAVCIRTRQVSGTGSFPEELTLLTGQTGSIVGDALPANNVAVISWYSETYTKSGRGRSYYSGADMDNQSENTWEVDQVVLWDNLANVTASEITDASSGAKFKLNLWTGTPKTAKSVVRYDSRNAVRKLRGRTTRSCSTT